MRNWVFLFALAAAGGFLGGCGRPKPQADPAGVLDGPSLPADREGATPVGPKLPLADGFEGETIAGFWLPGNYGTGLYEPGAIVVSKDYARSGTRSARLTVKEGDIEQRGDDGRRVERAELDSGHYAVLGRDVWYGFSFLLPPNFPIVDNRLVLASWKQSDVEGSPLIGQRFQSGRHSLSIRPPGVSGSGQRHRLPDLRLGQWVDMVYHVRYSHGDDGRIEVWMDGTQVVTHTGPTAAPSGANRFYNKVGLYRDRWKEPMTMYVDNYTLGDGFKAVDPSQFDQRP